MKPILNTLLATGLLGATLLTSALLPHMHRVWVPADVGFSFGAGSGWGWGGYPYRYGLSYGFGYGRYPNYGYNGSFVGIGVSSPLYYRGERATSFRRPEHTTPPGYYHDGSNMWNTQIPRPGTEIPPASSPSP